MEQAVAIATTLTDIAVQYIQQLKEELRESRALNKQLQEQLDQQQPMILITAKDIMEDMLADASAKFAETKADEDYAVLMALQRKYDRM